MSNTISRLSIEEDAWERKDRSRIEEEEDKMNKEEVERFRKVKTASLLKELGPQIDIDADPENSSRMEGQEM